MGVEDCSQVDHWWVVEVCGIKKVELGGGGGVWHEKPKHISADATILYGKMFGIQNSTSHILFFPKWFLGSSGLLCHKL